MLSKLGNKCQRLLKGCHFGKIPPNLVILHDSEPNVIGEMDLGRK